MKEQILNKGRAIWGNKKARWPLLAAVGTLLVLLVVIMLARPKLEAEIGKVVRGNAVAAVYGTITVEPVNQVLVKSRTAGVIRELNAEEGETVQQGDVMAVITDEEQGTDLEEMKVELEAAQERLEIGPSASNELATKRQELERIEPLVEEGLIAPMELNRVRSQMEDLKRRVAQQLVELEQAVAVASTKYENARNRIEQGVIRAPIDGEVLEVFARLGETTLNNTQLFLVGSQATHLVAVVNEEDVGAIEEGMKAKVRLYSYGNRDFDAKVARKLSKGENQSFKVILNLTDPPREMLTGMTGEANIIIGNRDNTLMVPTRALRDGNLLYVVRRGKVRLQRVSTGYRNIEFCEILDGVSEGDKIILAEHDRFVEGDRVTAR